MSISSCIDFRMAPGRRPASSPMWPRPSYENGTVLPHEGTRPEQVHQFVRHLEVVGVSSSPIAVAYRSTEGIVDLVAAVQLLDPDPVVRQHRRAAPGSVGGPRRTDGGLRGCVR